MHGNIATLAMMKVKTWFVIGWDIFVQVLFEYWLVLQTVKVGKIGRIADYHPILVHA